MSAILPGLQAFSSAFNRIAMKKLLYILAGLGLAACTSDIEELPEVGPQPGREVALNSCLATGPKFNFNGAPATESGQAAYRAPKRERTAMSPTSDSRTSRGMHPTGFITT